MRPQGPKAEVSFLGRPLFTSKGVWSSAISSNEPQSLNDLFLYVEVFRQPILTAFIEK